MSLVNPIQRGDAQDAEESGEENFLSGFFPLRTSASSASPRLFPPAGATRAGRRGMALIDCIAYLALFSIVFGLAMVAFYRAHENTNHFTRNATEALRALDAGERWREDVRSSLTPPRLEEAGGESVFHVRHTGGDVRYVWREGVIFRQAAPGTNWVEWLQSVKSSLMLREARSNVVTWRWELELVSRKKVPQVRPLLSFQAVATAEGRR
jgi:hypothetical protein